MSNTKRARKEMKQLRRLLAKGLPYTNFSCSQMRAIIASMDAIHADELAQMKEFGQVLKCEKLPYKFGGIPIVPCKWVKKDAVHVVNPSMMQFKRKKLIHGKIYNPSGETEIQIYEVPCPKCKEFNKIRFLQDIVWEKGRPETAGFKCPSCGFIAEQSHKKDMVERGRWTWITVPVGREMECATEATVLGVHKTWPELAKEFDSTNGDLEKMKTFVTKTLGLTWRDNA